jgi:hypothetical protein
VYITLIEKSAGRLKLRVYSESLALLESDSFSDSYSLNFHMQALARKLGIEKSLLVVHDKDRNAVDLSLAQDENLFFAS